jgi:hypothetical protein
MKFDFEAWAISSDELRNEQTVFLINHFLVEQAITMFFGQEKQGKSWLLYALTKYLCAHDRIEKVFYVDQDNPKRQLKERKIDLLIDAYGDKLKYMARGTTPLAGLPLVEALAAPAVGSVYKGMVFIFDSTRDFVTKTDSDIQAKAFMEQMKRMREAGATILLIHHTTKSGKVIDGSAEFTKSADNVYEVVQRAKEQEGILFDLPVYRDRDAIKDRMLSVDTKTLHLQIEDESFSGIPKENEQFIQKVVELLSMHSEGLNQTALLEGCGKRRDDKTHIRLLGEYTSRFWEVEMVRRTKIYHLPKEKG